MDKRELLIGVPRVPTVLTLIIALISIAVTASCSWAQETKVNIMPETLQPGQVNLIEINSPQCRMKPGEFCNATLSFQHHSIPLKEIAPGRFLGFLPVALNERPGVSYIEVHLAGADYRSVVRKPVVIKPKKYREQHLKVSKKMVDLSKKRLEQVLSDQKAVRQVCKGRIKDILWESPFIWPVDDPVITSPFGLRRFFNGKPRSPHSGLDLKAREGTPIKSMNNGIVTLVRDCYLSGNTVAIDHGGGLVTLYAHLSKVNVTEGEKINTGAIIGLAGSTGRVTGPHLHWGVSIAGIRVDPKGFMAAASRKP